MRSATDAAAAAASDATASASALPAAALTAAAAACARRVLTDEDLFRVITSFQSGWPHCVIRASRHDQYMGSCEGAMVSLAIKTDDLPLLQCIFRLRRESPFYAEHGAFKLKWAISTVVAYERLEILQWLDAHTDLKSNRNYDLVMAAGKNNFPLVQWLFHHRPESYEGMEPDHLRNVFNHASLELIKWIHENVGVAFPTSALGTAAERGDMEMVRYIQEHHPYACDAESLGFAYGYAPMEIVEYIHERRQHEPCNDALHNAAVTGRLENLRFIQEHRFERCTTSAMDGAAECGHFDVVQFLHEHRHEGCTSDAIEGAASRGYLRVVQFLHEHYHEHCTEKAFANAVRGGHLDVVKYLHEHCTVASGLPILEAASYGHFEVVKYLVETQPDACLHSAWYYAKSMGLLEMEAFLEPLTDTTLEMCVPMMHSFRNEQQRCRKNKNTAAC